MGSFSTDEKSDKLHPVFHPVEDDRVDRKARPYFATIDRCLARTKPGKPVDHKGKMEPMIREKSLFTVLSMLRLCSAVAVDRLIYSAIALRRDLMIRHISFSPFIYLFLFYLISSTRAY